MRFLVDDQLPTALARWIAARDYEAQHVYDVGLTGKSDRLVWEHARATVATVVTKDHDFLNLQMQVPGPAVVWITMGNCSKSVLLTRMSEVWGQIISALNNGELLIEVQ